MSEALILTGKRGQGKTLHAVSKIREYLLAGRLVATNLDLDLVKLVPAWNKTRAYRVPDFPEVSDLQALPLGNPNPLNERMNGLLVLDEAAAFLNSRSWSDNKGERLKLIAWLAQSRKFGWDLVVIAQHARMIDAQVRESLFELCGLCVCLDKMMIPFVSRFAQWLGFRVRMPKVHRLTVRMGSHPSAPLAEHIFFTGADLWAGYDTLQKIDPMVGIQSGCGYVYLSAWERRGRLLSKWVMMRKVLVFVAVAGLLLGAALAEGARLYFAKSPAIVSSAPAPAAAPVYLDLMAVGSFVVDGNTHVLLSDGSRVQARAVKTLAGGGREYEVQQGKWVKSK